MLKRGLFVVLGLAIIFFGCEKKSTDSERTFSEVGDVALFDAAGNASTGRSTEDRSRIDRKCPKQNSPGSQGPCPTVLSSRH